MYFSWHLKNVKEYLLIPWRFKNVKNVYKFDILDVF